MNGTPGAVNFPRVTLSTSTSTLVPISQTWKYEQSGTDFGTAGLNRTADSTEQIDLVVGIDPYIVALALGRSSLEAELVARLPLVGRARIELGARKQCRTSFA